MKVLISHVFGFENRGDASLARTLRDEIMAAFPDDLELLGISKNPKSQASFLPDISWGEAFGTSSQINPWLKRVSNILLMIMALLVARITAPDWAIRLLPSRQATSMRHMKSADLVVSCAGGFLEDAYVSIYAALTQFQVAHWLGIPVIIAPQSIGPIRSSLVRFWLRRILNKCRHVFVREEISEQFLNELGIPAEKYSYFPDLALLDTFINHTSFEQSRDQIGLSPGEKFLCTTCVAWAFPGFADIQQMQSRYEEQLAHALNKVQNQTGLPIVILNQVATDMPVNERVKQQVRGRVLVDTADRSPEDLRAILSNAELVIASRFHSCLFGLMARRPVLAISYIHKTDGIMKQLNLSYRVQSINSLDGEKLASDVMRDLENPDADKDIVEAMKNFNELSFAERLRQVF